MNQVACTNWKRVLSQANGAPVNLDVHSERAYRYMDLFSRLSPAAKQRVLGNYFKFIFVRHPFERLVSAHHDKLVDGEYVQYTGLYIVRNFLLHSVQKKKHIILSSYILGLS